MFDIEPQFPSKRDKIKQVGKKVYEQSVKKRDGRKVHKTVQYALYAFVLFFLLTAVSFASYPPYAKYIYSQLSAGKESITRSMDGVMEENFNEAFAWADLAKHNFSTAFDKFKTIKNNFFISNIKPLNDQFTDIERVLKSTDTLSNAMQKATFIGKEMEDVIDEGNMVSFSKFSLDEKRRILEVVEKREKDFEDIKEEMDIATGNLNDVEYYGALEPFKELIEGLKMRVTKERDTFTKALPMLKIMPGFFGYPKGVKYLIVIDNSNLYPHTIRDDSPSLAKGVSSINEFFVFNILYGEIMGCEAHPVNSKGAYEPIKKWFREDGDISFQWNELARNINRYYPDHIGFANEFDGIITGSPKFIREFFDLSGSIIINGTEYNKNNIFDKNNNFTVKQADKCPLLRELKIRIFDLPPKKWADFIDVAHEDTETKNINATVKNQKVQEIIRKQQAERE